MIGSRKNKRDFNRAASSVTMTPGEMIRTLRELKTWSQLDLARATGISQTNISAIENNRVQIGKERAIVISEQLGVHPASIMFADYQAAA